MSAEPEGNPPPLTDVVRARVIALAAEALPQLAVENLPAALRRVAAFAPARRAKVAGGLISGHLESDDTFREHLAVQVRSLAGEVGRAVMDGAPPPEGDPVELAALAFLLRPTGWRRMVEEAAAVASAERRQSTDRHAAAQIERLRNRLAVVQTEAQQQGVRAREQMEKVKAENTDLRRKLGEVRVRLRQAEDARGEAEATSARLATEQSLALAESEAETRRLRSRVVELESTLGASRRSERAHRVEESVRARLLVDALVEASQGLRRELGLPVGETLPADTVLADLPAPGSRMSAGRGSLPVDDPALLEELLRLPRAHLVVDGYNVTKEAWPALTLERQRDRLLSGAAALWSRTSAEVTVVFDAADTAHRPLVSPPRGVRVVFSPAGVIADDVIRDLVAAEPRGRSVVVASSDRAVAQDVLAAGFRVVASGSLAALIGRSRA